MLCFGANLLILFENYCETKLEINWISEKDNIKGKNNKEITMNLTSTWRNYC